MGTNEFAKIIKQKRRDTQALCSRNNSTKGEREASGGHLKECTPTFTYLVNILRTTKVGYRLAFTSDLVLPAFLFVSRATAATLDQIKLLCQAKSVPHKRCK